MTRARALKQVIRARAEKTGERYTTARRQVLKELPAPKPAPAVATKGGLSDAKSIEKTGHGLAHWFTVLDRFGGIEKGHTASTAMLHEQHDVPGWYCQGIVVAYERARGKRVMNQRCDGAFEVSVSKVMAATPKALIKAMTDAKERKMWSLDADAGLVKALEVGLKSPKSKGFVTRPDGQARFRYKWDDVTVQFNLYPKGPGKTSFVVSNLNLAGADAVDEYRAKWKAAFGAIAALFDSPSR